MYIYIYILKKKKKKSDNKMGAWKRKKKFKLNGNEQKPLWWSIQAICSCSAKSQVHLSLICYTSSDSGMGWMWTESADSVAQKKKKIWPAYLRLRCAARCAPGHSAYWAPIADCPRSAATLKFFLPYFCCTPFSVPTFERGSERDFPGGRTSKK